MNLHLAEAICAAILPGWRGQLPPEFFPPHVSRALFASAWVFEGAAVLRFGRPLRYLTPTERETLIEGLSNSRLAPVRGLVQWWKLVTLVCAEVP